MDDEPDIREALQDLLSIAGVKSVGAASGEECLQQLTQQAPSLILLDLTMPGMSGVETLQAIRKEPAWNDVTVVLCTSAPHLAPPGVPLLPKPVDVARMLDCVRKACGEGATG